VQLSVKYRPQRFAEVAGQSASVRILINSILMGRVPAALLFSGMRGVGKTTLARLYAKALNCPTFSEQQEICDQCESCVDASRGANQSILEFDAASYSGVEHVRDFEVLVKHTILHRYRILILDEVHMLSKSAQAALLKILEEPPPNTVFILVTTDPQRLEDTIRSRCLQMPLQPLSVADVASNVRSLLEREGHAAEDAFVENLALLGGGSLRDVQQVLERLMLAAQGGELSVNLLRDTVGIVSVEEYGDLADVLDQRNLPLFLKEISRWYWEGRDLVQLYIDGIPILLRDFSVYLSGLGPEVSYLTGIPYESLSGNLTLSLEDVRRIDGLWEKSFEAMKYATYPKVVWELFATRVCGQ